jgi:hypothetical protein
MVVATGITLGYRIESPKDEVLSVVRCLHDAVIDLLAVTAGAAGAVVPRRRIALRRGGGTMAKIIGRFH